MSNRIETIYLTGNRISRCFNSRLVSRDSQLATRSDQVEYCHFLVVESGDPFKKGDRIHLTEQNIVLGRSWDMESPQIAFSSSYVSRKHAEITYNDGRYYISDLSSKHGTRLNGEDIKSGCPCELNKGDCIEFGQAMTR